MCKCIKNVCNCNSVSVENKLRIHETQIYKSLANFVAAQKLSSLGNFRKSRHIRGNRSEIDTSRTRTFMGHHSLEKGRPQHVYFVKKVSRKYF